MVTYQDLETKDQMLARGLTVKQADAVIASREMLEKLMGQTLWVKAILPTGSGEKQ